MTEEPGGGRGRVAVESRAAAAHLAAAAKWGAGARGGEQREGGAGAGGSWMCRHAQALGFRRGAAPRVVRRAPHGRHRLSHAGQGGRMHTRSAKAHTTTHTRTHAHKHTRSLRTSPPDGPARARMIGRDGGAGRTWRMRRGCDGGGGGGGGGGDSGVPPDAAAAGRRGAKRRNEAGDAACCGVAGPRGTRACAVATCARAPSRAARLRARRRGCCARRSKGRHGVREHDLRGSCSGRTKRPPIARRASH